MDPARRYADVNLIADPLYGYIEITKGRGGVAGEQSILDSRWLQRLRRIHQLQSAWWVFPTAEHSRFSHLLGSMHLATVFARSIDRSLRASFVDTPSPALVESTLRLAGLLHDVGHGPFGHFFDQEVLARYGMDHEDVGRRLIVEELGELIASLRAAPQGPFEIGESVDPKAVAWVMAPADLPGYEPPAWLRACKPLLCGPATIDNLDYVPRDAYMCGVSVGGVDVRRIAHYSFVTPDEGLVLHARAVGALQMFLVARLYLYTNIYFHRTVRRIDLSMREIFAETVERLLPGDPLEHRDAYARLTDWSLLEAAERWRDAAPGTRERTLGDAWAGITHRRLRWHMAYETQMRTGTDVDGLGARISAALPAEHHTARVVVDLASASVAPANPMTDDGFVAIYDPLRERVERSRTVELVARLPQYNQLLRVFTDDRDALEAVGVATAAALAR